jgi:hypothetical protein
MPADLRRVVHQLVAEAAMNLQDVLRCTEPDVGQDWRRMTLYRSTDAADTVDMAALLIAAYLEAPAATSRTFASICSAASSRSGPPTGGPSRPMDEAGRSRSAAA